MTTPSLRRLLVPARPTFPETVTSKEELVRLAKQVPMTAQARQHFNELLQQLPLDSVGLSLGLVFLKVLADEADHPPVVKTMTEYAKDQVRVLALEGAVPFIEEFVPHLLNVLVSSMGALLLTGIWVARAFPVLLLLGLGGILIGAICLHLRQRAKKQSQIPSRPQALLPPSPREETLPPPSQLHTRYDEVS